MANLPINEVTFGNFLKIYSYLCGYMAVCVRGVLVFVKQTCVCMRACVHCVRPCVRVHVCVFVIVGVCAACNEHTCIHTYC